MKYCLFTAFFALAVLSALFVFACGEVEGGFGSGDSALCNGTRYETKEKFCFENEIYQRCGGDEYDPNTQDCLKDKDNKDKVYPKCFETPYDPDKSFCYDKQIYLLCGDSTYIPSSQGCLNGVRYPKCFETLYDNENSFCYDKQVYSLCGNKTYNPLDTGCFGGSPYPVCNKEPYDNNKYFCFEKQLYLLCQSFSYNPNEKGCFDGKQRSVCNGIPYDETNYFCFEKQLYHKCNGGVYSPSKEKCSDDGELFQKCLYKLYDETTHFCFEDVVYPKCSPPNQYYFPYEQGCLDGVLHPICDGVPYDNTKHFCFEKQLYLLCGTPKSSYNPNEKGCLNDKQSFICGPNKTPYDSTTHFCFGDAVYSKCGNSVYSNGEGCFEGEVTSICGPNKTPYSSEESFCYENAIYAKCNISGVKTPYNPNEQGCFNGQLYSVCGNKKTIYDNTAFCFEGTVYPKCGGLPYYPNVEGCLANGSLGPICNGKTFNTATHFCFMNTLYDLCGSGTNLSPYTPTTQICNGNIIYSKCADEPDDYCKPNDPSNTHYRLCGSSLYTTSTQFCINSALYGKCGGVNGNEYDPSKENCCGSTVYELSNAFCPSGSTAPIPKCRGEEYDNSKKFCSPNTGDLLSLCNGQQYNDITDFCHRTYYKDSVWVPPRNNSFGETIPGYWKDTLYIVAENSVQKCNNAEYDASRYNCINNALSLLPSPECSNITNPATTGCCKGKPYSRNSNFCFRYTFQGEVKEELYPLCGQYNPQNDPPYDPRKQGCFKGVLYDDCSGEDVRGMCVYGTNLRCRQEIGSGDVYDYIIDPLPGMTCNNTGAITGTITSGYQIAQIGRQIWLAENLKDLPATTPLLVDWATAMNLPLVNNAARYSFPSDPDHWRGPCPAGFYIPDDKDWQELIDYAGGASIAGGRLKSASGWDNNGNGTDNYGFNALPDGYYNGIVAGAEPANTRAMWWSLTQHTSNLNNASYWTIISADTEARNRYQNKALHKAYVRCLYY